MVGQQIVGKLTDDSRVTDVRDARSTGAPELGLVAGLTQHDRAGCGRSLTVGGRASEASRGTVVFLCLVNF